MWGARASVPACTVLTAAGVWHDARPNNKYSRVPEYSSIISFIF